MSSLTKQLAELMQRQSISQWGVANIAGLHPPLTDEYPTALSIAMAYQPTFSVYEEKKYHDLLKENRSRTVAATDAASAFLRSRGIKHLAVPQGGQDPKTLLASFPHKLAATHAGMGWIGKCSLLITKKFGPRIDLATILIEAEIVSGAPVASDNCGECRLCVDACPYGCIHNANWYPGIAREKLFDAHLCSLKREEFIPKIGHKHECGLCLFACPYGKDSVAPQKYIKQMGLEI